MKDDLLELLALTSILDTAEYINDEVVADEIRDAMDGPWHRLANNENTLLIDLIRIFSAKVRELNTKFLEGKFMNITVEKLDSEARIPTFGSEYASGMDLYSLEDVLIPPLGRVVVHTGIKVKFPHGYEMQIRPRSGLAAKKGLTVLNTPGTIDSDYRGEIMVILYNSNLHESVQITKHERIAQGVITAVVDATQVTIIEGVVSEDETDRGAGKFGSSGTH